MTSKVTSMYHMYLSSGKLLRRFQMRHAYLTDTRFKKFPTGVVHFEYFTFSFRNSYIGYTCHLASRCAGCGTEIAGCTR